MNRIVVTGGAGFIGSNLVRELQRRHPQAWIVVIDDFRSGSFANLQAEGDRFLGDVFAVSVSRIDLDALIEKLRPDVIFHEASITDTTIDDEAGMVADNVDPFRRLLEIVGRHRVPLVWASSAATYGTQANGATAARRAFRLDDAGAPANVYGFSKWVMENLHRQFVEDHPDAHIVGLRYFNVFGPGEENKGKMASMVYQLAEQMRAGRAPRIFFDGEQARDQVPVADVVEATIAGAAPTAKSGIYNVGSGTATSFNDIVAALNEGLETSFEPDYFENPYPFYQDFTCADLSESTTGLGWEPTTDVREAIVTWARGMREAGRVRIES